MHQARDLDGCAGYRFAWKVFSPDLRDDAQVGIQIGRVDVQFDDLIKTRTRSFQAFLEVLEYLSCLGLDVAFPHNIPIPSTAVWPAM